MLGVVMLFVMLRYVTLHNIMLWYPSRLKYALSQESFAFKSSWVRRLSISHKHFVNIIRNIVQSVGNNILSTISITSFMTKQSFHQGKLFISLCDWSLFWACCLCWWYKTNSVVSRTWKIKCKLGCISCSFISKTLINLSNVILK